MQERNSKFKIQNSKFKNGFTLIELLVVIAIIGILSSVVMVSLSSTRERARVAALQSTLSSVTTIANLCINDGGSVQAPAAAATGGNTIFDDTPTSNETRPDLSAVQGLNNTALYVSANDTTIIAGIDSDGGGTVSSGESIVTCTVSTGNCDRGTQP